ncbi:MAG: alpha/beta hydrolase [Mycobacteriaceae bacterium]|uniref:alpha/beta hydrolase n=1 Tax=Corynebacterium sp. TaxID=1720 RepID=UPI003F962D81
MTVAGDGSHVPDYTVAWSRSPGDRDGTPLVVMLHGIGSHEDDLMGLVPHLPDDATYASLRAPVAMDTGFGMPGYTWFELDAARTAYTSEAARKATEDLAGWVGAARERHSSVILFGFSMGMAMSTSLLRTRPGDFAAVVGLSGFAIGPTDGTALDGYFHDDDLTAHHVPFFWGRDPADPVIPPDRVAFTGEWASGRVDLTQRTYHGVGHGIGAEGIAQVAEFLRAQL